MDKLDGQETSEIGYNDFDTPVSGLVEWQPANPVNRQNFVSLLVESFTFSRGNIYHQGMFLEWVKAKTGFNYQPSIRHFLLAGGWDKLSSEERDFLNRKFTEIKQHKNALKSYEVDPGKALALQLNNFTTPELIKISDVDEFNGKYGSLGTMDFEKFKTSINDYYPRKKD